jgi:hypothetical protein
MEMVFNYNINPQLFLEDESFRGTWWYVMNLIYTIGCKMDYLPFGS